jgi:hypothetical protein
MKIVRLGDRYVDVHAPEERARVSATALKSFFALMQEWEVPETQARALLGRLTNEEFALLRTMRDVPALDATKLKRIATLLGIRRELTSLYGPGIAGEWVRLPNSHAMFCRVRPIDYMVIGGVQATSSVLRMLAQRRRATCGTGCEEASSGISSPRLSVPPDS